MSTAVITVRAPGRAQATLRYLPDFQEMLEGELRAGGRLHLDYAIKRVACRRERLGVPIWSFQSFIRFHPAGQLYHGGMQASVPVPSDATEAELWFYSSNIMACSAWDSRFGQNYLYRVAGPAKPVENVRYREGAVTNLEIVNVFQESATKVRHYFDPPPSAGSELQTRLLLTAWVRNVAFAKNVWVDVHVFDGNDDRIHAETFTLHYLNPAEGSGDFFRWDNMIYQGSGGGPGSSWTHPDARKVQYRLYYEVNQQVFTDGILHEHEVQEDAVVWNPAPNA